jgi:hypothetical protein
MIHHFSIAVADPERVATVLAELLGGFACPFLGPIPGAWAAYAGDAHGTGIEVYPERTAFAPGEGEGMAALEQHEAPAHVPFHALLSVKVDRAAIERIGAREGWRTVHLWRGPNPQTRLFEVYEFWIENRIMLELATAEMLPAYVRITNAAAQKAVRAGVGG